MHRPKCKGEGNGDVPVELRARAHARTHARTHARRLLVPPQLFKTQPLEHLRHVRVAMLHGLPLPSPPCPPSTTRPPQPPSHAPTAPAPLPRYTHNCAAGPWGPMRRWAAGGLFFGFRGCKKHLCVMVAAHGLGHGSWCAHRREPLRSGVVATPLWLGPLPVCGGDCCNKNSCTLQIFAI